jgi:hypothetical protein
METIKREVLEQDQRAVTTALGVIFDPERPDPGARPEGPLYFLRDVIRLRLIGGPNTSGQQEVSNENAGPLDLRPKRPAVTNKVNQSARPRRQKPEGK